MWCCKPIEWRLMLATLWNQYPKSVFSLLAIGIIVDSPGRGKLDDLMAKKRSLTPGTIVASLKLVSIPRSSRLNLAIY